MSVDEEREMLENKVKTLNYAITTLTKADVEGVRRREWKLKGTEGRDNEYLKYRLDALNSFIW